MQLRILKRPCALDTGTRRVQIRQAQRIWHLRPCHILTAVGSSTGSTTCPQLLRSEQPPQRDDKSVNNSKIPLDPFMPPSSSKGSKGGGPEGDPQPPPGPNLPPQLQQLLALLTEFGGKYGTAAVVVAWLTHIDPFGGLHWDAADVQYGLLTFLPLMLFDAALMLPDYSIEDPQQQKAVAGMFLGQPQLLSTTLDVNNSSSSSSSGSTTSSEASVSDDEARRMADAIEAAAAAAGPDTPVVILPQQQQQQQEPAGTPGSSNSSSSSAGVTPLLRLRVAMGVLQQVYTRANPGIGLSPAAELCVVLVATLADEMLYRAVGFTLLGLWIRDRLFEAGFDDDVTVSWITSSSGQALQMPTSEYARYLAVAVIAGLGMAGFAFGAYREVQALKKMQVIDKDGDPSSPAAQVLKSQLVSSLGAQNVVLYGVEGLREVTASVMAGLAFLATNNLAAPLAGSVVVQALFSLYQRISLGRARTKRKAMVEKVKQRQQKVQAAMAAALAAKQAEEAAAVAVAGDTPEAETAAGSSSSNGSSGADQQGGQQQEEEVDFLTAVLRAAEEQQQRQQQPQQQQPVQQGTADSTPANWLGTPDAATSNHNSSSTDTATGGQPAAAAAADKEAAEQQLSLLLEDMLQSPEGKRVVQHWMAQQGNTSMQDSLSGNNSGSNPEEVVEKLLADPAIKARLLAELQQQLLAMSEASAKRQQQLEKTWRQKL